MYTCPGCGSQMALDPATQKLQCAHCGRTEDPADVSVASVHKAESTDGSTEKKAEAPKEPNNAGPQMYQTHIYRCPSCGAELISTEDTVATFCSYCGSSVILEHHIEEEAYPDYVIPFQITREQCEASYRSLLRRALFVPKEMKEDTQIERFRGIYMPYWIYSFEKNGSYSVQGKKSRRRGDYIYTKHYRLKSEMDAACKGLSYDASSKFADNLSGAIAPFDARQRVPFSPAYLSGFYADRGDVYASVYRSDASEMAGQFIAKQVKKERTYRKYDVSQSAMAGGFRPKRSEAELGMFPVWFLGCRSHDGKRISYAVVNGQTGKVAADLPIDLKKYLIGSLLLAVPLFFLLNLFLTLTPTKALLFAIGLALAAYFLSNRQLNMIYTRDLQLDDQGLQSVGAARSPYSGSQKKSKSKSRRRSSSGSGIGATLLRVFGMMAVIWGSMILLGILIATGIFGSGFSVVLLMLAWFFGITVLFSRILKKPSSSFKEKTVYSAPMKEKWPTLYKPLLAVVIALLILLINPVADIYYYIGAAAAFGCIIWSFFDIIQEHNLLTTRKLPQMGKRGGDERA